LERIFRVDHLASLLGYQLTGLARSPRSRRLRQLVRFGFDSELRDMTSSKGNANCLFVLFAIASLWGQAGPQPRPFEVASIRLRQGTVSRLVQFSTSGTRLTLEAYPVAALILEAYDLKPDQLAFAAPVSQPDGDAYYDISAKAEGDGTPTRSEFREVLQTLLAERFNLKVHRAMKEMPVYALVVGKSGPKFQESSVDADFVSNHGVSGRNQTLTMSKATMESLAQSLWGSFAVDRPVMDRTGLTGTYDLKLEATPESRITRTDQDPGEISVFTAVQGQLGLRLEPRKLPVEILVVDHIDKPSEN
jgi:uncharacterized protein (TIGR03435 family)